ncbi:uncharacterized protein METZ01_LOCUS86045 [marine metagenome]|uniref:Uncharacterized protein n=1 Tax=marine metagenome TaxID=408172 RepID=A0A381UZM9_9ZZZZ
MLVNLSAEKLDGQSEFKETFYSRFIKNRFRISANQDLELGTGSNPRPN